MPEYLESERADAPEFTEKEMKQIGTPIDLIGLNLYGGHFVKHSDDPRGCEFIPPPLSYPQYAEWFPVNPQALYWRPRTVSELWNVKDIYITENGFPCADQIDKQGNIMDTDRVMLMRNYLPALQRATAEGIPVRGYFAWSLLDNFEWLKGYTMRFGLYHTDFKTLKRTPKLSAHYYRETLSRNDVV